jgi:ATP phosphoribosyltransferase regulatory subunit
MPRWLLPDNVSDVLPREARRVEWLRRAALDLYASFGYELVIPPLIEYVDSLLTGTGSDLDLRTFKLTDQASGRLLGLRADTTPQVARIDAHILNRSGVTRLCYAGSVLHARPLHPLAVREPLQVGAELYGLGGVDADLEVIGLAIASLRLAGLARVRLDLGHTGVVRGLFDVARCPGPLADEILAALSTKDMPSLSLLVVGLPADVGAALTALMTLNGGPETLQRARGSLPRTPLVTQALDELEALVQRCDAEVTIDLADLHGYRYLTGVTFSVHVEDLATAVLRGGRYDDIGKAFGRARPAVGFSIYLRELARLQPGDAPRAILAPADSDSALRALITQLRASGEVVVQRLPAEPADSTAGDFVFDRVLARANGRWSVTVRESDIADRDR